MLVWLPGRQVPPPPAAPIPPVLVSPVATSVWPLGQSVPAPSAAPGAVSHLQATKGLPPCVLPTRCVLGAAPPCKAARNCTLHACTSRSIVPKFCYLACGPIGGPPNRKLGQKSCHSE